VAVFAAASDGIVAGFVGLLVAGGFLLAIVTPLGRRSTEANYRMFRRFYGSDVDPDVLWQRHRIFLWGKLWALIGWGVSALLGCAATLTQAGR
jgi:hypothetical protein